MFVITSNDTLVHILRSFFPEERIKIINPSSIKKLEIKNEIVITDEAEFTKLVQKPKGERTIIVFVENMSRGELVPKIINLKGASSYKLRDFVELISFSKSILKEGLGAFNKFLYEKEVIKKEFIVEGDIKYIPEEIIDRIVDFIEENKLDTKVDRDNVIISSSEIIDNIIEVYIYLNQVIGKMKLELKFNEESFEVAISDYLGLADIYLISKSMKADLIINNKDFYERDLSELLDSITVRGRGYTLMKRASNRVVTMILRDENKLKYNCDSGFTKTSILYYFNKKRKVDALNVVIEFC